MRSSFPLAVGLLLALALAGAVSVPLFRIEGTASLESTAAPAAVVSDFEGPTPPLLAFQWASPTTSTPEATARYEFTYPFGRRSVGMETEVRTVDVPEGGADRTPELTVTASDRPWATYVIAVRGRDGGRVVDAEWAADRRFGLRRLPQLFAAERYRVDALTAQGYDALERDVAVGLRSGPTAAGPAVIGG